MEKFDVYKSILLLKLVNTPLEIRASVSSPQLSHFHFRLFHKFWDVVTNVTVLFFALMMSTLLPKKINKNLHKARNK